MRGLEPYKSHDSCDSEACPLHDGLRGSTETGPGLQHHSYSCTAPQLSNFPAQLKLSGSRARYRYRYSSSYSPTATAPRSSLALQLAKDTATAPDQQPFTRLICCEAPPEVCLARAGYPQAPKHIFINCSLLLQKKSHDAKEARLSSRLPPVFPGVFPGGPLTLTPSPTKLAPQPGLASMASTTSTAWPSQPRQPGHRALAFTAWCPTTLSEARLLQSFLQG